MIRVRVKQAQRDPIEWHDASLDQLVPKDHRVRAVWAYLDSLDLTALYEKIRAVEGGVGRDAVDPHARRAKDTDEMFAFRQRMQTEDSKAILKRRPSIAEFPKAECRNRGLHQFRIRGLEKVRTVSLWYAITFNLMRMWQLGVL